MKQVDVMILGAGAAGLFAAIEAARRGRRVLVVDHARAVGEKIRISGGGRCNFTNRLITPDRFLSQNPRFARSALARYTAADFIARVNGAGIAWHEKTLGQLFCDGSSQQIIDMLRADLGQADGEVWTATTIGPVTRDAPGSGAFTVQTAQGAVRADALIVATGGLSIPKMGATGLAHDLARRFGLGIVETRPGLVSLTFADTLRTSMAELAGLALHARVSCGKAGFEEGMLFTHRGLSGPSILQISSYWTPGDTISIDFMPGADAAEVLAGLRRDAGAQDSGNALARVLPERLARRVCGWADVTGRLADLDRAALARLASVLGRWQVRPAGSEGYRTAEVTLGGIDTRDLDARSLQARNVPGLYFVGEAVDVTGWLGGYNFQWAWSSGWAAGQVA